MRLSHVLKHIGISMGRIVVHFHGKSKDKSMSSSIQSYSERILPKGIKTEVHSEKLSVDDYLQQLQSKQGILILLDEGGDQYTSEQLATLCKEWALQGHDTHLAIGPFDGWPKSGKSQEISRISLSLMTFPHELASVLLLEQLYRATEINRGSGYHKA